MQVHQQAERFQKILLSADGQLLAKTQVFHGNREPPGPRGVAKNIPREGEHGFGISGMGHDLGGIGCPQSAQLNCLGRVHSRIDKDDGP